MMKLHQIYHPITATPYKCTKEYMEFPPCDALKPYIRCFWGSREVVAGMENRPAVPEPVIPDTCMDIIFTVNHTDHSIESSFCGIDDRTFFTQSCGEKQNSYFIFGIRFYPWSVSMFTEDSMKNTKNAFFDAGYHFSGIKKEITAQLFDIKDMYELIPVAERILLHHFHDKFSSHIVLLATSKILETKGSLRIADLKQEVLVSSRQLERLFLEYVGIPPKSLAAIVRYQYMWNDFVFHPDLPLVDAVYKYGYSDQAHLCREFKKYHSMNISEARNHALPNVGNIQDGSYEL